MYRQVMQVSAHIAKNDACAIFPYVDMSKRPRQRCVILTALLDSYVRQLHVLFLNITKELLYS